MNWLRLFLIVSILFWQAESPNCVVAEVSKVEKMNMCTNYVKESTAALSVEDWTGLERIAKKGIQNCKEVFPSDSYSGYYESLAMANIEQNKLMDALGACEKCIDIFYKNAGCHFHKMLVLVKLGKKSEAQNQFKITDRLVNYLIKETENLLRDANMKVEKKLYSAQLNKLNAQKRWLDKSRSFFLNLE